MPQCIKIFISYLYEAQHVSGDTPPIIRSLKLHQQPLVLHTWRVVGRVVAGRWEVPGTTRPTTLQVCKTRGWWCSFRLLMMGGVLPETCWASYKYEIKILIRCGILLDFLCELNNRPCDEYYRHSNSAVILTVFAGTCSWRTIISRIFINTLSRSDTPADVCIFVAYESIN